MEEEKEEKVTKEEFFDEKKNKKSLFNRIMNVVLWIVLFALKGPGETPTCLIDFFKTTSNKEPVMCISKQRITYSDGYVDECVGLGYKVYNYRRTSFSGNQYGPFWIKDRSAETK